MGRMPPGHARLDVYLRVVNRARGTVLGDSVREAGSFLERLAGLLRTRHLPSGAGLWIAPCRCVHTFGMRYPIDLAFVGPADLVVGVSPALPPNRISRFCPAALGVLEVPAGTLEATGTGAGDRLEFRAVCAPLTGMSPRW
jgi:uncharacterized membrane protein (UPF0127 family)